MTAPGPATLRDDLRRDYGLDVTVIERHPGGFESECWVADGTWFVKVWRGEPPARLSLLERLRRSGLPVVVPLRTRDGMLRSVSGGRPYAVFPFVHGRTGGDDDWAEMVRALKRVHEVTDVALPRSTMEERCITDLRARLDHPWIRDRRREVASHVERLEEVIERARSIEARHVLCHLDFGGFNLLLDHEGIAAILDWDQACLAPREHDVWVAAEGPHGHEFLEEYGASDLDPTHLEYALLARGLRDMAARVCDEVDRPGVDAWGFARLARLESDLEMFRPFCRA
jgi:hypothetical protein